MPEYVADNFSFLNFTSPVSGILRKVIDNDTTTRDKISLIRLGMKKENLEVHI